MRKIKSWLIITFFTTIAHIGYSQNSGAYIVTDSSLTSGIKLIGGTSIDNHQFIRLKNENEEIKYYPEQLLEYGLRNGTVYKSKSISVSGQKKQVFLERLEYGKINLYYYTEEGLNTYFLERDSTVFIEIKKDDDFRKTIAEQTSDFDWKASQSQFVKYNRMSLSKFVSLYNNNLNKPFPFPRFGILAGFNSTSLTIPSNIPTELLEGISFTPSSTITLGVFADLPIDLSDFSVNLGVNFLKSGFSANSRSPQSDVDVVINYTSLSFPFLIRYTLPRLGWRPFINAGGLYSYHFRNEGIIYESLTDQNVVTISDMQRETLIADSMLGYSFGLGLQRNLDYRKIAALEFRFNQLYGNENTLTMSHFEILTSFSF